MLMVLSRTSNQAQRVSLDDSNLENTPGEP